MPVLLYSGARVDHLQCLPTLQLHAAVPGVHRECAAPLNVLGCMVPEPFKCRLAPSARLALCSESMHAAQVLRQQIDRH